MSKLVAMILYIGLWVTFLAWCDQYEHIPIFWGIMVAGTLLWFASCLYLLAKWNESP